MSESRNDRLYTYETSQPWVTYFYPLTDEEADAAGGLSRVELECLICGTRENASIQVPRPGEPLPPRHYRHPARDAFLAAHVHPGLNRNPLQWEKPLRNLAALKPGDVEEVLGVVAERARRDGHEFP